MNLNVSIHVNLLLNTKISGTWLICHQPTPHFFLWQMWKQTKYIAFYWPMSSLFLSDDVVLNLDIETSFKRVLHSCVTFRYPISTRLLFFYILEVMFFGKHKLDTYELAKSWYQRCDHFNFLLTHASVILSSFSK